MSDLFYDKLVPADGPEDAKILFVGEAPGENEHEQGKPFVGESGRILIECLNRAGVLREDVRLANLFNRRPKNNDLKPVLSTKEFLESLSDLYNYIEAAKPNVIGALGNYPLQLLTGRKGIMKWRGSILPYIRDLNIKVIPTIHPAAIFRDATKYPIFDQDIKRIITDGAYPERNLPTRQFIIDPRGLELEEWTVRLCSATYLGTDIETVKNSKRILCVGFAPSPEIAVCINAEIFEGQQAIRRILESDVDKIFQFGIFDTLQLLDLNGYQLNPGKIGGSLRRPYYWDTLVAQHTLAPELPRSLEYLTSIYTREPYYKTVGRGTIPADEKGWSEKVEKQSLYEYNCRDCCCTIEIALKQMEEIASMPIDAQKIFDFQMSILEVSRHVSASGMLVDEERRQLIEDTLLDKWNRKQAVLNRLCGQETNVRSPKLKKIMYEQLGIPPRYKDKKVTTDEDAIVASITFCKDKIETSKKEDTKLKWSINLAVCQLTLEIRGIRVVISNYIRKLQKNKRPRAGDDGRIRSTYKAPGTETGRWSASKYVDGTGFNSQTLPRDPLEVEDKKSDLTSADRDVILAELDIDEIDDEIDDEDSE